MCIYVEVLYGNDTLFGKNSIQAIQVLKEAVDYAQKTILLHNIFVQAIKCCIKVILLLKMTEWC